MDNIKLEQKRENHTCQILKGNEETLIVLNGGWSGSEAISHYEVFKVLEDGKQLEKVRISEYLDEKDGEKQIRNRPCSITIPL